MIAYLRPLEAVEMDFGRLAELQIRLGILGTDAAISNAMEEVAVAIPRIQDGIERQDMTLAMEVTCDVEILAAHVGMTSLSRVARTLAGAITSDDRTAMAAVSLRLMRVWETSMTRIWEDNDLSL